MIGSDVEIGEDSVVQDSVIGAGVVIGNSVIIKNCIIWDNVEISGGCTLTNALICEDVVIGCDCEIKDGAMLDKDVEVNDAIVLEKNTIVSCLEVEADNKGAMSFKTTEKADKKKFEKGIICFMPNELKLEPHQYMGQPMPYEDEDESDLEESEDDEEFDMMTDKAFRTSVQESVTQIIQNDLSIDCALINMKEMKHGYSKNDQLCQAAIYPAVLS